MVQGFKVAREIAMIPKQGTSGEVTRRTVPLSGKKNYFWPIDHWNSLYQPKAFTNDHVNEFERMAYPYQNGWCGLPCWRQRNRWICLPPEMNGTHDRTTSEDDPGQQLLRRTTHGKLAQWGASWEQHANVGMILITGKKHNSREWFRCLNGYSIIKETESTRTPKEQLLE